VAVGFHVLGPVEVRRDGVILRLGGAQQRRMLGALLIEPGRVLPIARLVEVVWPDGLAPDGARRTLMSYVSRLRAVLGDDCIFNSGAGYYIRLGSASLDSQLFEERLAQARAAAPTLRISVLDGALALWGGQAFGEFADEWWARPAALRLEELRLVASEERFEALLAVGEHEQAVSDLEAFVSQHPLRERAVGQLMRALRSSGRQTEALRVFASHRKYLADEIGLAPSDALLALERSILSGDDPLLVPDGPLVRGYVLGEVLGEGSTGTIYRARQPGVGREVAIKVIRADLANSARFVERFEAEAQLIARLEHPHIVPLYDFWREPGGAYLVLRLLRGGNAEQSLRSQGSWTLQRATQLVDEIGGALTAAHAAGVVHRDVKPANVLFDERGRSYLADFGIATSLNQLQLAQIQRLPEGSPSSMDYASPEQLVGELSTPQSDLYSFASTIRALLAEGDIPAELDSLLRQSTDVVAARRPSSVAEFVGAWHESVKGLPRTASGVRRNPYKGLRPFAEADTRDFCGRTALTDELVAVVDESRFVMVVGPSGSGKSSLVQAGLVPRLRASGSRVAAMTPGEHPAANLRTALSAVAVRPSPVDSPAAALTAVALEASSQLVLVVDQLEEAWTLAVDDDERDQFLSMLASPPHGLRVVATLRADFYDRPLGHPLLGPVVAKSSFGVTPMTVAELAAAVAEPAAAEGVSFEPALEAEIVADMAMHPASLPLLQFALSELFEHRVGDNIPLTAANKMGGIDGAIVARAEALFADLDPGQQQSAHRLFTRLVTPGEGGNDVRRRARHSELTADAAEVAERFATYRLLTVDRDPASREPTIEVAHEALLRSWPRLQGWLDVDRDWLGQLHQLSSAARSWDESGREPTELLRGPRLALVSAAVDQRLETLGELDEDFLRSSQEANEESIRRETIRRRRSQRLLVATAVALVLALVGGSVAFRQRREALDQRTAAQLQSLAAQSVNLRSSQRDLAALLAVEAYRRSPDDQSKGLLWSALTQTQGFVGYHSIEGVSRSLRGSVLADGPDAVVLGDGVRLIRIDIHTGAVKRTFEPLRDDLRGFDLVRSSTDGRRVAEFGNIASPQSSTELTGVFGIYDAETGERVVPPIVLPWMPNDAAFSPDGTHLAVVGGRFGEALLYSVQGGRLLATLPPESFGPTLSPDSLTGSVAYAPDGRLFIGSEVGDLRVLDPETFKVVERIPEPDRLASDALTSSPDGSVLLTINGSDGHVSRIDPSTGKILWGGSSGPICGSTVLVPHSRRFYCALSGIKEYNVDSGQPTGAVLPENGTSDSDLAVADAGNELVAFGGLSPIVAHWRIDGGGPIDRRLTGVNPGIGGFLLDGHLVIGADDSDLIDTESGTIIDPLDGILAATASTTTPVIFGARAISGGSSLDFIAYDPGLKRDTVTLRLPAGEVGVHAGSPNNQWVVLGMLNDTGLDLWRVDVASGQFKDPVIHVVQTVDKNGGLDRTYTAGITNDGRTVFIGDIDGVRVFDATSGNEAGERLNNDFNIFVTDKYLVTSGDGGTMVRDLSNLALVATLSGAGSNPFHYAASADGRMLQVLAVNTTDDGSVALYDLDTFAMIGQPIHVAAFPPSGDIRPDGLEMAIGSDTGTSIWDLDPDHWVTAACAMAGRNLTQQEWGTHLSWAGPYRETCPSG
jgi:serine/threonine protein kinase/DNA-binding SARP family transcriptional activator/WD40 repeat protein